MIFLDFLQMAPSLGFCTAGENFFCNNLIPAELAHGSWLESHFNSDHLDFKPAEITQ